jgi:GT2 family glycosyltransferase
MIAANRVISEAPLCSIVIVNFRGTEPLRLCLSALLKTTYPNIEIIVVDFGTKGLAQELNPLLHEVKLVHLEEDIGVAAARNKGVKASSGPYLAFLDNDTLPEPEWLTEAVKVLQINEGIAAVQSLLLNYSNPIKVDGAGCLIDISGFPMERGRYFGRLEDESGQFQGHERIFGASAAAMVVKRSVLEEVGLFDPDFFIELEEVDLCWRIRLAGYDILLAEKSRVLHRRQSKAGLGVSEYQTKRAFHSAKNQILCLVKNMSTRTLARFLPLILAGHFVKLFMPRDQVCSVEAKALWWNLTRFPASLRKRRTIQETIRRESDAAILKLVIRLPVLVVDTLAGTTRLLELVRRLEQTPASQSAYDT